jgi:Ca-activated chloride channel homolog
MQQNIDQRFKDGIDALAETPAPVTRDPQASWDRIEGMLAAQPRKRKVAWIWVSAAATVALLIALGWGLSGDVKEVYPPEDNPTLAIADSIAGSHNEIAMAPPAPPIYEESQTETGEQSPIKIGYPSEKAGNNRKVVRGGSYKSSQDFLTSANRPSNNSVAGSTTTLQQGQTFAVTANGAATYAWSASSGAQDFANKNQYAVTGSYTVNFKSGVKGKEKTEHVALNNNLDPNAAFFETPEDGRFRSWGDQGNNETYGSESYAETIENDYFKTTQESQSTFSIDVDRASYTNHRRFIDGNSLPPKYAVRVEEFINYFPYEYQPPHNGAPFSILPEVTTCPWNTEHKLVRIALKGREVSMDKVPASNIVFLLDVSGSMSDEDKLPLLKKALIMLTEQLREQDKVSIVVYAGAAGLVLPATSGNNKAKIMAALDQLEAGGSTAGGEGIELAYATAKQNFKQGGNNRVILATDGDFNVGVSDDGGLEELIVRKRAEGVFLSVLGFGEGNLQDSKMEMLADKGNGNYNYIDGEREAKKVLVSEFGGTLYTIAKDVKVQVEFNPDNVQSYRLIGYENRKLKNEDFANDKIDAGELGAGHTVTAFYEIVPRGAGASSDLKYQQRIITNPAFAKEILTVKLRYKEPDGTVSKLLEQTLQDGGRNITQTSNDFRWAVAVAAYGMILRQSDYKGTATLEQVIALAKTAVGTDKEGYRREFIELATKAMNIEQMAKLDAREDNRR